MIRSNPELTTAWQASLEPAVCEYCDWRFLLPAGSPGQRCPHCFRRELTPLEAATELTPYPHPPELVLPFTLQEGQIADAFERFSKGIPFAPRDLKPAALQRRMRQVYLPQWLVDAEVTAQLKAEMGYDYQVVSHQEYYAGNRWNSREVRETRIRWKIRLGQLKRTYHNIPVPALEEEDDLLRRVGNFQQGKAQRYDPSLLDRCFVHLPDRPPDDAWPEAVTRFREAATRESMQAAGAQHVRDFQWSARYAKQEWTQLLRPLVTSYYLDDEGQPHRVWLHGRSGRLFGERRASMKRAQRVSLFMGATGAVFFALALLIGLISLAVPPALILALILALVGFALIAGAIIPPLVAWNFNRQQSATRLNDPPAR